MLNPYSNLRFSKEEGMWQLVMGRHVLATSPGTNTVADGHRAWVEMTEDLDPGLRDLLDVMSRRSAAAKNEVALGGNGTASVVSRNVVGHRGW